MISFQGVAYYLMFTAIERDIVARTRQIASDGIELTEEEEQKSIQRLTSTDANIYNLSDPADLMYGLDILEKYQVLLRHKDNMSLIEREYYEKTYSSVAKSVQIRNSVMHGRVLSLEQSAFASSLSTQLANSPEFWPSLTDVIQKFQDDPSELLSTQMAFISKSVESGVLNNLPVPDFEDTGYLPRPRLERELRKKLLGRYPVVSILGEGGNGKTALALKTLYSLIQTGDHDFELIIWISAKNSELSVSGIKEIAGATTNAVDLLAEAAFLEIGEGTAEQRLRRLLEENKVLLAIDNYETVVGNEISILAEDVPGDSKILFTSRRSIGVDLTVVVNEFDLEDAVQFFWRLLDAYSVHALRSLTPLQVERYLNALSRKPLLIKWFVLGVHSGLDPERIIADPETALHFCLDNVILTLSPEAQAVLMVLVIVPVRTSAGVINYVSNMDMMAVHDGIGELSRAGVLEIVPDDSGQTTFGVRSFARSYVKRLLNPRPDVSSRISEAFAEVEAGYRDSKSVQSINEFALGNYRIRNRTEMLAARKLRLAIQYAQDNRFDVAESYLSEAKNIAARYSEVFRVEAFLAHLQREIPRSVSAYENAIELDPDDARLHFLFGGLLMRIDEHDRASSILAFTPRSRYSLTFGAIICGHFAGILH